MNISEYIWIYLNTYKYIWISLDIPWYPWCPLISLISLDIPEINLSYSVTYSVTDRVDSWDAHKSKNPSLLLTYSLTQSVTYRVDLWDAHASKDVYICFRHPHVLVHRELKIWTFYFVLPPYSITVLNKLSRSVFWGP